MPLKNKQLLVTSDFDFRNYNLKNLKNPIDLNDATTKEYVDNLVSVTAKSLNNIELGDKLYWGSNKPYDLEVTDKITFDYITQ